ncbi:MAG TPA: excinuclease ABC subunit UvrA [Anaerolineales bacterium]|nr:excinuclease ABC subunit UvrA [Anaerolineales bacterium]
MEPSLSYYTSQSPLSDPGAYAYLYEDLPADPQALARVVQGVLIHKLTIDLYAIQLSAVQRAEVNLISIAQRLRRLAELDATPLVSARPPAERQVAVCRDFALLFVSLLRHQGIPARMRVGFAEYLFPKQPYKADHWVAEYWNGARWVLADAQIDEPQRNAFQMQKTNPLDLRQDVDFYPAGKAWQLCRAGKARSSLFRFSGKWKGYPCIRGNLLHDFQALNKIELSPIQPWDIYDGDELSAETGEGKAALDQIASLTCEPEAHFAALRSLFDGLPRTAKLMARLHTLGVLGSQLALQNEPAGPLQLQPSGAELVDGLRFAPGACFDQPASAHRRRSPRRRARSPRQAQNRFDQMGDIHIRGARQHNLQHIDVTIPRNRFVVITGVSGSGKSSLAFDTLYAEGQRRYVESLSSYARQFMEQMEKPQVDQITGLSPAIAIEQKTLSRNPRSTVGTVTEVLDYLRVLFARLGLPHCPQCGQAVQPQSAQQISGQLASLPPGTHFHLLAPIARARKGTHMQALREALRQGYARARVNGQIIDLAEGLGKLELDKNKKHDVELVVDRLVVPPPGPDLADFRTRLMDSVETGLKAGGGVLMVLAGEDPEFTRLLFSEHNACPNCEISFPEMQPAIFSFNSPLGMCPECNGLGVKLQVDPALIITQPHLSLMDGASPWYGDLRKKGVNRWQIKNLEVIAEAYNADLETPWNELSDEFRHVLLYGAGDRRFRFVYEGDHSDVSWHSEVEREAKGIIHHVNRLFRQTRSEGSRRFYMQFMSQQPCPKCQGERLCPEARFVTVGGKRLPELTSHSIGGLYAWINDLPAQLDPEQHQIGDELIAEIRQRLLFIRNVGLHYLTLDRSAPSLSGGEGQRIRLASQIGSGLVGVLYILDEPSIGLHPRDHHALLDTLLHLRNLGNTVVVVEHDAETMRCADWIIDLGPGPGVLGGKLVAAGSPQEIMANPLSLTGRYLSGELAVTAPNGKHRRQPAGHLVLRGACLHNLKHLSVRFPLGLMTCITGVSGSGKSSLISHTLFPALERVLHHAQRVPGPYDGLDGLELVDKVINITQEPIGRNPRSNPGTYVGVMDEIRKVFTGTPEARALGYGPGRFSFNVKGGRCESCAGYGFKRVEMHFLPDVWVTCKECGGKRFNSQTLSITYKDKNIADVLDMDVQQALEFFAYHPSIARILQTLHDVGLDYVKLGQSALTLSGGEAQRVKLAKELSRLATGRTVYILDEPTTGLHFADIQRLLDVLHRLVDAGNTVIVIEHNLDVIKTADWIIDLGPEGGEQGGYVVAEGTPEQVASIKNSDTGSFLHNILHNHHDRLI